MEPTARRSAAAMGRRDALGVGTLGLTSAVLPSAALAASVGGSSGPDPVPVLDAASLVQATGPNTPYPSSNLLLKNYLTVHRICYVRFDLTGTAWVSAAAPELRVTTASNNDDVNPTYAPTTFDVEVYGLKETATGYGWSEATLTWNTRPAAGTLASGRYVPNSADAVLLGEIAVAADPAPAPCTLTGTGLRDFIRGLASPSVTFILIRKDVLNTNLSFYDDENGAASGYAPSLTLG